MSESRPAGPVRRPDTARPRSRDDVPPEVAPPSLEELAALQRHIALRPAQEGAVVTVADDLGVTFVQGPGRGPDSTYAALPRWTREGWSGRLAALQERMRRDGYWPSILLFDPLDESAPLSGELERRDWVKVAEETIMWVGHASIVPHLDPMLRIEAVQPRTVAVHEAVERAIFGIAPEQAEQRRTALRSALEAGHVRAWIVRLDDQPIAVARLSQGEGVAGIQGVGVVEARRGQGFATLITTIATRAGMAVGNRVIWLSVDEDNTAAVRVYRKLGFTPAFGWTRWLATEDTRDRD